MRGWLAMARVAGCPAEPQPFAGGRHTRAFCQSGELFLACTHKHEHTQAPRASRPHATTSRDCAPTYPAVPPTHSPASPGPAGCGVRPEQPPAERHQHKLGSAGLRERQGAREQGESRGAKPRLGPGTTACHMQAPAELRRFARFALCCGRGMSLLPLLSPAVPAVPAAQAANQ